MGFIEIRFIDIIDIVVVALLMFYLYKIARGTPAPSILLGILLIYITWVLVGALNMEMLSAILGHVLGVGVIALIVLFQPEIRKFLQVIGAKGVERRNTIWARLFYPKGQKQRIDYLPALVRACVDMSNSYTGALIVIQQETPLDGIAETGIAVDARISSSLIKNIFFKNSPLHDGALIIKDSRIEAAKCVLPSTQSQVPVSFGMRHRAALGISEISDAIIIVVSEETGGISIAQLGQIKRGIAPASLEEEILAHMHIETEEEKVEATESV